MEEDILFIEIHNCRFRKTELTGYKCSSKSGYTGSPSIIEIWRKNIKEALTIVFENTEFSRERYQNTKDELDSLFLGKTESQAKLFK